MTFKEFLKLVIIGKDPEPKIHNVKPSVTKPSSSSSAVNRKMTPAEKWEDYQKELKILTEKLNYWEGENQTMQAGRKQVIDYEIFYYSENIRLLNLRFVEQVQRDEELTLAFARNQEYLDMRNAVMAHREQMDTHMQTTFDDPAMKAGVDDLFYYDNQAIDDGLHNDAVIDDCYNGSIDDLQSTAFDDANNFTNEPAPSFDDNFGGFDTFGF